MKEDKLPIWLTDLDNEELEFIKFFVLASGSLKELAKHYEITYPTIRLRLDRLIQKIEVREKQEDSDLVSLIKKLTLDNRLDLDTAKELIEAYNKEE